MSKHPHVETELAVPDRDVHTALTKAINALKIREKAAHDQLFELTIKTIKFVDKNVKQEVVGGQFFDLMINALRTAADEAAFRAARQLAKTAMVILAERDFAEGAMAEFSASRTGAQRRKAGVKLKTANRSGRLRRAKP